MIFWFFVPVNIITIILFSVLFYISSKKDILPKQRALWASLSGAALFLYLLSVIIISIFGLMNKNYPMASMLIFVFIPFVIGTLANYETLKKYLLIQIGAFALSLIMSAVIAVQMVF